MKRVIITIILCILYSQLLGSEINVYFSHSVDTTLANPNKAQGFVALDEKLIQRIVQAQHSIDFCFYNIKRQNIVDSLLAAFIRGVDVRVITEHDHVDNQAVQDLINAGIPVIDDTFGNNLGDRYMHNKFTIFDFRDSSSVNDDWIWTGSCNITDEGTESNANSTVEIQYNDIARAYTLEFEEMWGSKTNVPDPDSSKFSFLKTDNTQHFFIINSIPVELYFSPSDHSTQKIRNAITTADSTIYFCIFAFTRQDVCDEMKTKWDTGISVKGVFDKGDWFSSISKRHDMTGGGVNPWNPPAPVFLDSVEAPWGPKMLHHKYMLIDSDCDSSPIVVTGSQNWSNNGEFYNDENTLIIHNHDIANQYLQEFVERYQEAGGEYVGVKDSEDRIRKLEDTIIFSVYPNPFTLHTEIRIQITKNRKVNSDFCFPTSDLFLEIYNVSGRLVKSFTLATDHYSLTTVVSWDGKDNTGQKVFSGIYFLKLNSREHTIFKKITLIR